MSRVYRATFTVGDADNAIDGTAETIVYHTITRLWSADDRGSYYEAGGQFVFSGTHALCGGESEDEFVQRVRQALWLALKRYVPVEITLTYMEELPCETYISDESEYAKFIANN